MRLWLAVALLAMAITGPARVDAAGSPVIKQFQLYATDGYMTMPDGQRIYIWGYSLKNEPGTAGYPSPTIEVNEGDQVEITLTNIGPSVKGIKKVAHTIHWHGLDTDQANDGVPHTSAAIQVGESYTYTFTAGHAGTYFYHCHVDTIEHLQMGMFGAFIVKAAEGVKRAWTGGPAYDKDYVFVVNEIDPVWHKAVEEGRTYNRTVFHPVYWTMNGKSFPDTEEDPTTMIEGRVGETVLVRIVNAGYESHSFHMHGFHFDVIASDGRPLPQAVTKDTVLIGPGERYDLLVKFDQDGMFPLHSHNITDNTNNGVYPGGLHTMMNVMAAEDTVLKKLMFRTGDSMAVVDGESVTMQQAVQTIRGYNYVPLRFIAEQLGADLTWDQQQSSATVTMNKAAFQLWVGKKQASANGKLINLVAPPVKKGGNVMVPLRFVSDQLGGKLSYDSKIGELVLTAAVRQMAPGMAHGGHDSQALHADAGNNDQSGNNVNPGINDQSGNNVNPGINDHPDSILDPLTVEIRSSVFAPGNLTVKKGQTVTWTNKDTAMHTVYELDDLFRSPILQRGESFSFTFTRTGTYTYYCSVHPIMQGEVKVIE